MEKLKNKVFFVIFLILTIFLVSILFIFNTQNYHQNVSEIQNTLMRMDNNDRRFYSRPMNEGIPDENMPDRRIFMDSTIYTVELDSRLNIINIINHTTNEISEDEISNIVKEIVNKKQLKNLNIGNIFFDDYSYLFTKNRDKLIILDNTNARNELMQLLKTSLFIFIVLEIVIIIASKKLTNWIIQPVVEAFNKQKQFIADASHELKTPLSVILASSEALENNPDEKKWLNNIKGESERMSNLVTDLLDMAKSEYDNKEQYSNENLSKLTEKSILTFEGIIFEKNIKLDYKIEENIEFLCNKNQINQLIGILLDNAVKHSIGEIKVSLKKEKGIIQLDVTNNGKEIPKEEYEKIFERFYRADESRNRNENRYGLGLAIAKNIVTNHNGKISVNSENGYTTFKVIFK